VDALQEVLDRHLGPVGVPGVVVLIAHGAAVRTAAAGPADVENGVPVRRDPIVRLASITEPNVAAAAMQLVHDGRLTLGRPDRAVAARARRTAGSCAPPTGRSRTPDVLRERLFEPLSVVDTDFEVPADKRARLVCRYSNNADGTSTWPTAATGADPRVRPSPPVAPAWFSPSTTGAASAGCCSTAAASVPTSTHGGTVAVLLTQRDMTGPSAPAIMRALWQVASTA
jgi:CubicO group peptidase (beta-lactamase class C family)